jgi:hypothetical protein
MDLEAEFPTGEPMLPVTNFTAAGLPDQQAVVMRLDFLTNPMQSVSEANRGRNYVLMAKQARDMAQRILRLCDEVERIGPRPPPDQSH